jgi:hypothetical protein
VAELGRQLLDVPRAQHRPVGTALKGQVDLGLPRQADVGRFSGSLTGCGAVAGVGAAATGGVAPGAGATAPGTAARAPGAAGTVSVATGAWLGSCACRFDITTHDQPA